MPIAKLKPTVVTQPQPELPKIESPQYKSIVTDDDQLPLRSLIAYVSGSLFTVNYYAQVLSEHNDLRELDAAQSGVYQQYNKIIDLDLRVTSPLSVSYDAETSLTTVTGAATMYGSVTPNISDYFTAKTVDAELALYRITSVERKTLSRLSAFDVAYDLVGYLKDQQILFDSLESKVNATYHFSKDRIVDGLSPLVKQEDYKIISDLSHHYKRLVADYFRDFYDLSTQVLIVPDQNTRVYDTFLSEYVLSIVDTQDAPEIRKIRPIPIERDPNFKHPQLWKMIFYKQAQLLRSLSKHMQALSVHAFNKNSYIKGLHYSGVDRVVYPHGVDYVGLFAQFNESTTPLVADIPESLKLYTQADITRELILPVSLNATYVLSEKFYKKLSGMTVLESLVWDYLEDKAINLDALSTLISAQPYWGDLERFYYTPLLLTLIKQANKTQYT